MSLLDQVAATSDPLGSLISGLTGGSSNTTASGAIPQPERLFTTRSRNYYVNPNGNGDRGQRAYIKYLGGSSSSSSLLGTGNNVTTGLTGGGNYGGYASFLLTHVHGDVTEKTQVVQTLGDGEVVYYFGREPLMFQFQGFLIDSVDNAWFTDFVTGYIGNMRGTITAQNYQLLQIFLPTMTLTGTIPHMSFDLDSQNDVIIPFEFQFLVKQITPTPPSGISAAFQPDAYENLSFQPTTTFTSQATLNSMLTGFNGIFGSGLSATTGTSTWLSQGIDSLTGLATSFSSNVNGLYNTISANLAGIRSSLFSPIFGVLTSLTKLLQAVQADVASVFNLLVAPVASIVRDIVSLESMAIGVLSLFNSTAEMIVGLPNAIGNAYQSMFTQLAQTTGMLCTIPSNLQLSLNSMVQGGTFNVAASPFFQSSTSTGSPALSLSLYGNISKLALLNSGPVPSVSTGATL
jgi:hypothetical protein